MELLHLAVVAVIQGLTEFIPVSSSGHLALVPLFMQVPDQGLVIDVAAHVGTLFAVIVYFWGDIWSMIQGLAQVIKGRRDPRAKLIGLLMVGTIPVLVAGFALNYYVPSGVRGFKVIGWTTLGFGLLLLIADQIGMTLRRIEHLKLSDAFVFGMVQVLALIPGTSRSGVCMTVGRIMGMERREVARFSMLLGIPAILGAGFVKGWEVYESGNGQLSIDALVSAGLAFVFALFSIALIMAWLRRASFTIFGIYRLILGSFILAVAYGWLG